MLRDFLLFCLLAGIGERIQSTSFPSVTYTTEATTPTRTTEARVATVHLKAEPDYPVTEGITVHLYCNAVPEPPSISWSWRHFVNQTWWDVSNKTELTLSKPEQSGPYQCRTRSRFTGWISSQTYTVYIIAMHPRAYSSLAGNLGIAAFALVVLILLIILAVFSWLGWKRFGNKLNTPTTASTGFPGPVKSPKAGVQQTNDDGDVYMNYTSTNQNYSDLDPARMTDENVYSSLS